MKYFSKIFYSPEQAVEVSSEISLLVVKPSRPFTEGDFVKKCLLVMLQMLCFSNCVKKF
jgi:hypothetical protein